MENAFEKVNKEWLFSPHMKKKNEYTVEVALLIYSLDFC